MGRLDARLCPFQEEALNTSVAEALYHVESVSCNDTRVNRYGKGSKRCGLVTKTNNLDSVLNGRTPSEQSLRRPLHFQRLGRQSAKCSRSQHIEIKRFGQISYLNELPVLSIVFPSQNYIPIVDDQAGNVILEALEGVIASGQCTTQHTVLR